MNNQTPFIFPEILDAFEGVNLSVDKLSIEGNEHLPSWYKVTDLAAESIAVAGLMLRQRAGADSQLIRCDRRLASLWFDKSIRPIGWELPPAWDSIAGNYKAADGWVRLHTNAPLHKHAALRVLDCQDDREVVGNIVKTWSADRLAEAVIEAGGCATAMHSPTQWLEHPQGKAVSAEPLIHWDLRNQEPVHSDSQKPENKNPAANPGNKQTSNIISQRPLNGIKVLDLTRILAGPIATRFLAAYGADILRIDPPGWDEPSTAPEVTLGKRCAGLNLKSAIGKTIFEGLLQEADLLVHGYRPGALASLGYDTLTLRKINPKLVDVSLCAYGWTGPWAHRRGFDSVVQMSCGIAAYGMARAGAEIPVSLPVQALDHATGYLIAAAAIHALNCRDKTGAIYSARLSLARTACLLMKQPSNPAASNFANETSQDVDTLIEPTEWGNAQRIRFPLSIEGIPAIWNHPAGSLHRSEANWNAT